jgi:hypothetical protein
LDCYAAVCRSEVTADVHAAFERSERDGFKAMRKAMEGSGIEAPDLDDFAWGEVMGMNEAVARAAVEDALEAAIEAGDLVVGGRGWRGRQREIAAAVLDGDPPSELGQSWRTVVVTERIGDWVRTRSMRSERASRRRADIANRLLHAIEPPADVAKHMEPVTWLLDTFGDEQALTQAGYLNRTFVVQVYESHPWEDEFRSRRPPRSETDVIALHRLRAWLEYAGALRKRGKVLRRTERGAAMAHDPVLAWTALTGLVAPEGWDRFVAEAAVLVLLGHGRPVPRRDLYEEVAADAIELGWRTTEDGVSKAPSDWVVGHAFHTSWALFELFGFGSEDGDWQSRTVSLSPAGESTALAILRAAATGPRKRSW